MLSAVVSDISIRCPRVVQKLPCTDHSSIIAVLSLFPKRDPFGVECFFLVFERRGLSVESRLGLFRLFFKLIRTLFESVGDPENTSDCDKCGQIPTTSSPPIFRSIQQQYACLFPPFVFLFLIASHKFSPTDCGEGHAATKRDCHLISGLMQRP